MKDKLASNPDFFVDFVGDKSNKVQSATEGSKKMPINPTRLHVSGFGQQGMITADKLRKLFPKCINASIPAKNSTFGFVTFENPADAKAAFDAANQLKVNKDDGTQHLTVVFARLQKRPAAKENADEKSDAKKAKIKVEKAPKESNKVEESDNEVEDEDSNEDDQSETEVKGEEEEASEEDDDEQEVENDVTDDDDDESDE